MIARPRRAILASMRRLVFALLLLVPCVALAGDEAPGEAAALREKIVRLEQERDAALVRANTYVLPKDKLEAQAKQQEIDAARKELEALEKGGK